MTYTTSLEMIQETIALERRQDAVSAGRSFLRLTGASRRSVRTHTGGNVMQNKQRAGLWLLSIDGGVALRSQRRPSARRAGGEESSSFSSVSIFEVVRVARRDWRQIFLFLSPLLNPSPLFTPRQRVGVLGPPQVPIKHSAPADFTWKPDYFFPEIQKTNQCS